MKENDKLLDWYGLTGETNNFDNFLIEKNSHNSGPDPITNPGTVPVIPEPSKVFFFIIFMFFLFLKRSR